MLEFRDIEWRDRRRSLYLMDPWRFLLPCACQRYEYALPAAVRGARAGRSAFTDPPTMAIKGYKLA